MNLKQKERSPGRDESKSPTLALELLSGVAGGLVGAWVMKKFTKHFANRAALNSRLLPYDAQEWDAASRIAEGCGIRIVGRALSPEELKSGAALVHYATGAAAGAFYGMIAHGSKTRSRWAGVFFGATVWLVGNELFLPALGVINRDDYTVSQKINALGGHLAFGLTTDLVCRQLVPIAAKVG